MMQIALYTALALTFYVVATGVSAILRALMSPPWQAVVLALMSAICWAPVRWWGEGGDTGEQFGGWHPLIGNWLLGEPANRPGFTVISVTISALAAYWIIRRWQRRNEPQLRSLH
jgi:hypothetical protein